ncbi:hypothetical protein M408DRAFT_15444 [Serendipita vermifera MAFF 305830]|uniref:Uncharacterized protein n=1 Tax=Serendipita vermifera MAFF 305830 TaxID=933852 RepID=A0A0C3BG08_SERVB|nr:hypothetical protein M408DRAFT_15444 [Serendipita vermifera MAFF 305830]
MCRQISDGCVSRGCGHYIQTTVVAIADCQSRQCRLSSSHAPSCRGPACRCNQTYGPDIERTTSTKPGLCDQCLEARMAQGLHA